MIELMKYCCCQATGSVGDIQPVVEASANTITIPVAYLLPGLGLALIAGLFVAFRRIKWVRQVSGLALVGGGLIFAGWCVNDSLKDLRSRSAAKSNAQWEDRKAKYLPGEWRWLYEEMASHDRCSTRVALLKTAVRQVERGRDLVFRSNDAVERRIIEVEPWPNLPLEGIDVFAELLNLSCNNDDCRCTNYREYKGRVLEDLQAIWSSQRISCHAN